MSITERLLRCWRSLRPEPVRVVSVELIPGSSRFDKFNVVATLSDGRQFFNTFAFRDMSCWTNEDGYTDLVWGSRIKAFVDRERIERAKAGMSEATP